jgi:hypothetical protein
MLDYHSGHATNAMMPPTTHAQTRCTAEKKIRFEEPLFLLVLSWSLGIECHHATPHQLPTGTGAREMRTDHQPRLISAAKRSLNAVGVLRSASSQRG